LGDTGGPFSFLSPNPLGLVNCLSLRPSRKLSFLLSLLSHRRWRRDGTWERIHEALRCLTRLRAGRDPSPRSSAADSQSVKSTPVGGPHGFDNGKKVNGRKRYLCVDSLGLELPATHPTASHLDWREGRYIRANHNGKCVVGVAYFGPLHLCTERTPANLLRSHRPTHPIPRGYTGCDNF